MRQILKKMLTASIRDSKIFKCKMITIPLEESARFAQQSPAWGTQEWEEIYCPARNAIESKNSYTLSLIHISEPTRQCCTSRMPSSA